MFSKKLFFFVLLKSKWHIERINKTQRAQKIYKKKIKLYIYISLCPFLLLKFLLLRKIMKSIAMKGHMA